MVQLCNDWLADGHDIGNGTSLIYNAKVTVAVDILVDVLDRPDEAINPQPYSYPPPYNPSDIDYTKTFTLPIPVTCAAWQEPPSAGSPSDVNTALPEPEIESAQLALDFSVPSDGAPHEYAGSCPVNVNLNMLVNTNVATPIWVWVKHVDDDGNNWTSDQAEFQTNQITNAGTWMWTRQEPLIVPVDTAVPPPAPAIPLGGIDEVAVGGGGGGGEPGGAAATAPSGVATGFTGDPNRHVGQVELFAGIGRQVVELPDADGPGSSQVVTFQQVMSSGLKTYDVTCIPEVGPIAADSPDTLVGAGNPVGPDAASPVDQPQPGSGDLATEPRTQASLDVPPIISLVLQDASVDPQHSYVNVPLGQDGFWSDGYSGTVTWRLLVGAVLNPALQGVGTQWTTIAANVGPWGGGATALSPQILSLAEPPVHKVVSASFVDEFMTEGDGTPQAICNTLRQNLLDQGQSLSGILGNHHIVDVTDDIQPRAQLNAALAYDQNEDPYGEIAVALLPLRIRCLGNPEIAERFLPSNDAPGGIATPEDFTLISADLTVSLDGEQPVEPATYAGSCPVNGRVDIKLAANFQGTAQYQVLHLSENNVLTASELTATAVDDFNNGGYWEFDASQMLDFPLADDTLPGFSTEPGGFVTGNFSVPAASDLVGNNTDDPNIHTGFFRVLAAPVGVPEPTADSLWKKYRIECEPGEGGIGEVAAGATDAPPQRDDVAQLDNDDTPLPGGTSGSDDLSSVPRTSEGGPPVLPLFGATVFQDETVLPDEGFVNVPLGQDGFWNSNFSGTVKWTMLIGQELFPAGGVQWLQIDRKVVPFGGGTPIDLGPQMLSVPEVPQEFKVEAPYSAEFLASAETTPDAMCNDERQRLLDEGGSLADILANHHILDVPLDLRPQATLFMEAEYENVQTEGASTLLKLKIRCLGNPEIAEEFLPSDDAPDGVGSPEEFNVTSAGLTIALDGGPPAEPATYAGSCPVDGQVDVKLTANFEGTAQYQVLHLSENNVLTASELTATAVDEFNNGGYWEFDASQTLNLPLEDATLPGFSTEPGGFVTGEFSVPAAGDLIGNNDNDPNVHTGFFRVLASPVGVPVPTADSLWKKYRIECDPGEGTVGDLAGQTGGTVDGDSDAVLDLTISGPTECAAGSECPLQVNALNDGETTIPGPLSIRIEPDLDGAGLGASNWSCGGDGAGMSCQSDAVDLAPDETAGLDVAMIVPGDAEPGSQFRICAVAAPPVADADPVRYTQFMLTRLGFDPKGIDGRSGPNTLRAVRDFRRDQGLAESGEIDDALLQALAGAGEIFASDEACATVAIVEGEGPEIVAPEPVEPDRPVIVDPTPQVSVCRDGAIRAGQCVCRPGWTRTRVSRFEYICNRPLVRIVCDNGTVRGRQCVCHPGWRLNRVAPNRFACVRPVLRVTCSGGRVVRNQCVCPSGTVRQVRGPNNFACVRVRPQPIACTGGVVRAGKCDCPRGLRLIRGVCVRPAG
ncbi:MAG TPA: peptidoglycan-binding domain-containing protein [Afifellaceae bacterium]|nr:peptidoglycan-binding domain-containing protein [Afifellaceae bacterium]